MTGEIAAPRDGDPATGLRVALVGFDLDILDLARTCKLIIDGYFDTVDRGRIPYLGDDDAGESYDGSIVFGLQSAAARERLWPRYKGRAIELISATAHIANGAILGSGLTVHHGAMIMPEAQIGDGVQIHPGVFVHHESIVGSFSTLSPRALILGRVQIGRGAFIGAGATIKENVKIGDRAVIAAGAVVVENVGEGQVVAGVPARVLVR